MPDRVVCKGTGVLDLITGVFADDPPQPGAEATSVATRSGVDVLQSMPAGPARDELLSSHVILAPLNEQVDEINKLIQLNVTLLDGAGQPAAKRVFRSADSVQEDEQAGHFPTEFLNMLQFSGVPPHELHLQVGAPIILLRNMAGGFANGTRLIVTRLDEHVLEAEFPAGTHQQGSVSSFQGWTSRRLMWRACPSHCSVGSFLCALLLP